MKINLRQEIALWVLGLLWTGLGVVWLLNGLEVTRDANRTFAVLTDLARQGIREQPQLAVAYAQLSLLYQQMLLVVIFQILLLVPISLIIFSLRDRKKPN